MRLLRRARLYVCWRLLFVLAGALVTHASIAADEDYLTPEQRRAVNELKTAFQQAPTTKATYTERAEVAWMWLNAYSRTGGSLPVNITTTIRPVTPNGASRGAINGLDLYLEELRLLDEAPDALGRLEADLGPFEARAWVTMQQRYTVGAKSISAGGGFLMGGHFQPGYGAYQVDDPAGDNYLSIKSSNKSAVFVPDSRPLSGMHGGFRGARPTLFLRVQKGSLNPGDVVTFTYGDRSAGSRGWLMGFPSTDFLPVPIYVDFAGTGHNYSLPIQPIRIAGTDLAGVHVFAPSVVRPGETFELSVRAQDRFYNRAKRPIPAFTVFANDEELGRVPAGGEAISLIEGVRLDEPGIYRITVASEDGGIRGEGNPILVSADATRVYWGDTHGHSGFAEGIGTPGRFMQWARDDARLDFVTHSEHDIWLDDSEWEVLRRNVRDYSVPGRFVGYLGYEWTTQNLFGGHHNVLYRDIEGRKRVPNQLYPTLSQLYEGLRSSVDSKDVLVIPHAHQAGDYRLSDPELEPLIEIMSQHGTFEWFGRKYLENGHQVGFVAASDNHLSQPGYTGVGGFAQRGGLAAVMAPSGSRDDLFDAMKARRTYATTGDKMILDVSVNDGKMGERISFAEKRRIAGHVIGTGPIDTVSILKNGVVIWEENYLEVGSGRYKDEETFYLTFESPSIPMHPGDNPRGGRSWRGMLTIAGAEITGFEATDFFHPERHHLRRDETNPAKLHFSTQSRGDNTTIKLHLRKVKRNATVTLVLEPGVERGSPTRFRKPVTIPGGEVTLRFADVKKGVTSKTLPVDIYEDTVSLRRVIETGISEVRFDHTDVGMLQGDNYFVRVKQANDALAWSSPVWVGGFPAR